MLGTNSATLKSQCRVIQVLVVGGQLLPDWECILTLLSASQSNSQVKTLHLPRLNASDQRSGMLLCLYSHALHLPPLESQGHIT